MNVQTMSMDPRIAKIHYQDYHRKVLEHRAERRRVLHARGQELGAEIAKARIERTRLEKEDEELMRAYKAMAGGQRILNLPHVLKAAGVQPTTHLPALAVAKADWRECFFRFENGAAWYTEGQWLAYRDREKPGRSVLRVSAQTFPAETTNTYWRDQNKLPAYPVKAIIPAIPAALRPSNFEDYFLLWDAVWEKAPPADPLLLKRVSPNIFAVVAQWDLTPLEQSILEGRIGQ